MREPTIGDEVEYFDHEEEEWVTGSVRHLGGGFVDVRPDVFGSDQAFDVDQLTATTTAEGTLLHWTVHQL